MRVGVWKNHDTVSAGREIRARYIAEGELRSSRRVKGRRTTKVRVGEGQGFTPVFDCELVRARVDERREGDIGIDFDPAVSSQVDRVGKSRIGCESGHG